MGALRFFTPRQEVLRIALPPLAAVVLFVAMVFGLLLPGYHAAQMERKKEMIRELITTAWNILEHHNVRAERGELPLAEAQAAAVEVIRRLRYGIENKDYFWINDMRPVLIMHPYRPDLEGQDVSGYADPGGKHLFVAFVEIVRQQGAGFVPYLWQWKDNPDRIVPKLSYVREFQPWGWVVGTGIYLEDVEQEIAQAVRRMALVSLAILACIATLSVIIIRQGLHASRQRREAVELLRQHRDRLAADVDERTRELRESNAQLLQSEKLASIGQLAAGVAHEINNPLGFIGSNFGTLENYLRDLFAIADAYAEAEAAAGLPQSPCLEHVHVLKQEKDYNFMRTDVFKLLGESKDGLERVAKIVRDLKDFSRVGEAEWQSADLHAGIDSTLNIIRSDFKYKCTVIKDYGDLPSVWCVPSQINQVLMNLLLNAGHAIETKGEITIRTGQQDDRVFVAITDTGGGIAPEHLSRIFDPFFTTKPIGKGTGLGLSLAYGIMQKHQGRIEVQSEIGKGTIFTIWLPAGPPGDHNKGNSTS